MSDDLETYLNGKRRVDIPYIPTDIQMTLVEGWGIQGSIMLIQTLLLYVKVPFVGHFKVTGGQKPAVTYLVASIFCFKPISIHIISVRLQTITLIFFELSFDGKSINRAL